MNLRNIEPTKDVICSIIIPCLVIFGVIPYYHLDWSILAKIALYITISILSNEIGLGILYMLGYNKDTLYTIRKVSRMVSMVNNFVGLSQRKIECDSFSTVELWAYLVFQAASAALKIGKDSDFIELFIRKASDSFDRSHSDSTSYDLVMNRSEQYMDMFSNADKEQILQAMARIAINIFGVNSISYRMFLMGIALEIPEMTTRILKS